jgi:hypothetical protein
MSKNMVNIVQASTLLRILIVDLLTVKKMLYTFISTLYSLFILTKRIGIYNMKNIKIVPHLILASCCLITFNCNTTEPGEENITPGRRDYEWTADTIIAPNNSLTIWGIDSNDIWACGPGGITRYDQLWHYDGIEWKPWTQSMGTGLSCLKGLAKNDVWLGGQDGRIFHFNGSRWSLAYEYNKPDAHDVNTLDILPVNYNDVYAAGMIAYSSTVEIQRGFLIHYDGNEWKEIFVSSSMSQFNDLELYDGNVFIENFIIGGTVSDTIKFYKYDGKEIKEIFSKPRSDIYIASMNIVGDKIYFLIGRDLYRYENGGLVHIKYFPETKFGYGFSGRSEKDIFIRMADGLAHYNGTDLQYLYKFTNDWTSILGEPVIFDNDVFFSVVDYINGVKFMLHGKLK